MRSSPLFVLPLGILLAACGGGDDTTGTSSTGGPSSTAPVGAVNMEIYATPEQSCPIGNIHLDIGNSRVMPPELATDAFEGAAITCKVVANGGGFTASGMIKKESDDFAFEGVNSSGESAVGFVTVKDPVTGDSYRSPDTAPCVFQFAPGSGQGLEAGKAWMQFDCSSLVSEKDSTLSCSSRYGYVLVDRCTKK
ncbi:MAG: hypothetical protein ABI193_25075 [Minicystis sp.]